MYVGLKDCVAAAEAGAILYAMTTQPEHEGEFDEVARAFGGVTQAFISMGMPELARRPSQPRRFRRSQAVAAVKSALARPQWGPVRAAKDLQNRGVDMTPGEVQQIWQHYNLTDKSNRMRAAARTHALLEMLHADWVEDDSEEAQLRRMWKLFAVSLCTSLAALALYVVS